MLLAEKARLTQERLEAAIRRVRALLRPLGASFWASLLGLPSGLSFWAFLVNSRLVIHWTVWGLSGGPRFSAASWGM